MSVLSTLPSDSQDPRFLKPRSPDCPNDVSEDEIVAMRSASSEQALAGTCAACAWGFYTPDSIEHESGEPTESLTLRRLEFADGTPAGYRSRCGKVEIFIDQHARVGALRKLAGQPRFFPGIKEDWAFRRFLKRHPELLAQLPAPEAA